MHQPEEDQQIVNHAYPQFGNQQMAPPTNNQHQSMGGGMPGIGSSQMHSMGLPSLMQTPAKMMQASSYQPSYSTPQSLVQPQTPVN